MSPNDPHRQLQRVLFAQQLDPSRKFGSMEEQAYALAKAFNERGGLFLPVYLGPLDAVGSRLYAEAGIRAEILDLGRFDWTTFRRLAELIRRERIDIINWNFYAHLGNPYLWALSLRMPRVRHDLTDHISRLHATPESARSLKSRVKALLGRRYRRIMSVSDYLDSVNRAQADPAQLVRWRHFVNIDRFKPDAEIRTAVRAELGDSDRFVLAIVAFLRREKGAHVAVEALSKLPAECVLWVVGGGHEEANLREQARAAGLADRVRFLGHQADVSRFVQGADCVVSPSTWVEAAGLANIEALACGVPIVASRIGGIPEFVVDGVTGYLAPPGDPDALAAAVRRLLDDPEHRRELARNAREIAVREHSTEHCLPLILDYYTK
ncbi:MAG: glycosyltransferase [Isosphaeraceae bacterium]|nr:glycosyltransferase [Isosphaeraceae bacterium]